MVRVLIEVETSEVQCASVLTKLIQCIDKRNWPGSVVYDRNDPATLEVYHPDGTRCGHFSLGSSALIMVCNSRGAEIGHYWSVDVSVDVMLGWVNE